MTTVRVALANIPFPTSPSDSVARVLNAVAQAGAERAEIVCFPEGYIPGYRQKSIAAPPPDAAVLEDAWTRVAAAAAKARVAVVLGTERVTDAGLLMTALVIDRDGKRLGFQDKVQLDPSEDGLYTPGAGRRVFTVGALTFGIAICH